MRDEMMDDGLSSLDPLTCFSIPIYNYIGYYIKKLFAI